MWILSRSLHPQNQCLRYFLKKNIFLFQIDFRVKSRAIGKTKESDFVFLIQFAKQDWYRKYLPMYKKIFQTIPKCLQMLYSL